ncbi:MAG: JDVT-CTERM system CAAX-type protease [Nitrospira sp.]|nr:JDVT-CTERM system CAAX-type protease [Nitrospira sp.]
MRLNFGARGMPLQQNPLSDRMVDMQGASSGVLRLPSRAAHVLALLGLQLHRPFHRDSAFLLLLALGPMVWLAMIGFLAFQPLPWHAIWSPTFLSVVLWQPLFEELLFRGIIQGYVQQSVGIQKTWNGLSLSNFLTSLLFTFSHLASHSISWSVLVLVPSLCFGFVRDRFGSVYPSIILHAFYNSGYFLLIGGATHLNPG